MISAMLAYAVLLLRDPSMLYRMSWFDRQMWGWLEDHWLLRPIALFFAALGVIGAAATFYRVFGVSLRIVLYLFQAFIIIWARFCVSSGSRVWSPTLKN